MSGNGPYSVREIEDIFEMYDFVGAIPEESGRGQRRDAVEGYLDPINWGSRKAAEQFLLVLEHVAADLNRGDLWAGRRDALQGAINRAGLDPDGNGRLRLPSPPVPWIDTSRVPAEAELRLHLERLERADDEPEELIGAAKDLVEATAQHVLAELGKPPGARDDVRALSKHALRCLGLHPEALAPTTEGTSAVKMTLQGLAQIAVGMAELRNEYGVGHGRAHRYRLYERHGELARRAAVAYAAMLVDTMHDPKAPWRKSS